MNAIHLLVEESVMKYLAQWGFVLCTCGLSHSSPTTSKQTKISHISSCQPQEDAFAIGEKVYDAIRKSPSAANGWAKPVVNFPTVGEIIKLEVQRLREAESSEEGAAACATLPGAEEVDMYVCGCKKKGPIKPKTKQSFKRHIKNIQRCPCRSMTEGDALIMCRRRCIQLRCGAWRLVGDDAQSDDTANSNSSDSADVQHSGDREMSQFVLESEDSLEVGTDLESSGDSSGKEDKPPNEPDVALARCKRKRQQGEDEDEDEDETLDNSRSTCEQDDPSSASEQHAGSIESLNSIDDNFDGSTGDGPLANDDEACADFDDDVEGISNDATISSAENENAGTNDIDNRRNVLLLGMSYPSILSLFGRDADPSPRDVAMAVEDGKITQIDARDLVRARALEKFADAYAYCVSLENAAKYDKERHLRANINDVSTKTKSFLSRLQLTWPRKKFQEIFLDYFWSPSSWVSDHWKSSFFSRVLPGFVKKGILEEGGTVYLPSCLHCVYEICAAIQNLSEVYRISFLHKSDLEKHQLWAACNAMNSDVKDNFRRWFGHAMGEEEKYCTLSIQDLKEYPDSGGKVSMEFVKQTLVQIPQLENVRMIVLSTLTASEKENRLGGFDFS